MTRGNVVIGARSQLGRRSHLAAGSGYTAASQTPHSQQTSATASVSRSNMFHKHVAQGGRRELVEGVYHSLGTRTISLNKRTEIAVFVRLVLSSVLKRPQRNSGRSRCELHSDV